MKKDEMLDGLIDLYVFLQNEPYNCKPSTWKRFVKSVTSSDEDIRCTEMDRLFELLKQKVITLINKEVGKETKLKKSFFPVSITAAMIKEDITRF